MSLSLVLVYRALNQAEAFIHKQLLEGLDIYVEVRGLHRANLGGMIPMADAEIELWVPMEQARDARKALGVEIAVADGKLSIVDVRPEEGALSTAGGEPEKCPECGEDWEPDFEVCWNCQWERE